MLREIRVFIFKIQIYLENLFCYMYNRKLYFTFQDENKEEISKSHPQISVENLLFMKYIQKYVESIAAGLDIKFSEISVLRMPVKTI